MQKIEIPQIELDQGDGRFHEYMKYVAHRITAKPSNPMLALFSATEIIRRDGLTIQLGSELDAAGTTVTNWFDNFFGKRSNISYCFPPIAYQLFGIPYLLRMPVMRVNEFLITQAAIDLTSDVSRELSDRQVAKLEREFNEFYDAFFSIARFDATTVVHLESAAQHIHYGAVHYALSRWESLHFIERAMKEVLEPLGVFKKGSEGHDVGGVLHNEWIKAGKKALPTELLNDVQCSANIRYEKTPQPFLATLRAHHSSIRLASLIANELPAVPRMEEKLDISMDEIGRDSTLALARIILAIDPSSDNWPPVTLIRD
jgi:hypothetical protein